MLARIDAGTVAPRREPLDPGAHLAAARAALEDEARARGLRWDWQVDDSLAVVSDPALVDMVLGNLLGNAVAYADRGGDIAVSLAGDGAGIVCVVGNSGSRVAAADAVRVCERFWRGDAARSDTTHHCGLGLALCQDVVRVLDGTLEVETELGGRFTVRVRLPDRASHRSLMSGR
jgi:signal transduction histidine kinase